jgi:hypothetical protein
MGRMIAQKRNQTTLIKYQLELKQKDYRSQVSIAARGVIKPWNKGEQV